MLAVVSHQLVARQPELGRRLLCNSSVNSTVLRTRRYWTCAETPNPKVRKFDWLAPKVAEASSSTVNLPAARSQLLGLAGVRDVFVAASSSSAGAANAPMWLSVTRADDVGWDVLEPQVQELLAEALQESTGDSGEAELAGASAHQGIAADIEECLDGRVRPSVQADGGDVELVRWDPTKGEVVLLLKGACRGCPQSAVTLQETILKTLSFFIPEVKSVAAEEEALDEDSADPYADIPFDHDADHAVNDIRELATAGTPFFSTFAGTKVEGRILKRVKFMSRLELQGRKPGHIHLKCVSCGAKRAIEDPQDIMRADKGNTTGNAAIVICPACCVLITP